MMLVMIMALAMDGKENLKMTLTRWLREKVEEEQRARDRAEGISVGHQRWVEWYRRLKAAEEKNEPFDEPPPEL